MRLPSLQRPGRLLLWAVVGAGAAGRVFGLPEVSLVGLAGAGVLVGAWVTVLVGQGSLSIERRVRPRRVSQGDAVELRLSVRARGRRGGSALAVADTTDGSPLAEQFLAPLRSGETRIVVNSVVAARRGIARLGPVVVTTTDPFGLTRLVRRRPVTDEVIVWPSVVRLGTSPRAAGTEIDALPHERVWSSPTVDDAPRLREFQSGDDVRRVHWPSTARLGIPIVREVDQPAEHRCTVLLDLRRSNHDGASLERAISAAASVLVDRLGRGDPVRLVTTSGYDTGDLVDQDGLEQVMDHLAAAGAEPAGSLVGALRILTTARQDGFVVACVGLRADDQERDAFRLTAATMGGGRVVSCGDDGCGFGRDEVRFGGSDDLGANWRIVPAVSR